jgi:hypothetical protein
MYNIKELVLVANSIRARPPYTSPPNTNMVTINDNGNPDLGWDRYNSVVGLNWLIGCQLVLTSIHFTDD